MGNHKIGMQFFLIDIDLRRIFSIAFVTNGIYCNFVADNFISFIMFFAFRQPIFIVQSIYLFANTKEIDGDND